MNSAITNETTFRAVLGAILANRRNELGLKQEDVAKAAGLSTPTWSRIEKGENPLTTEQLRRVGTVLDVSPSALIKLEEEAVKELKKKGIDVREELSSGMTPEPSLYVATESTMGKLRGMAAGGAAGAAVAGVAGATIGVEAGAVMAFAVPVVGPILGALIGGLTAYNIWKKREEEEKRGPEQNKGDVVSRK